MLWIAIRGAAEVRDVVVSILLCILLTGCATIGQRPYFVDVSGLSSQAAHQYRSYIILPGNKGVMPDDLQFQEYAMGLSRALQVDGFVPAETGEVADVVIVLSYGIGDPQTHQYSFVLPVFGQTGIASSYSSGVINSYGNSASYSGTTTYVPTYGVRGYMPISREYTTYFRYVLVAAYQLKPLLESKNLVELWQTTISSTGSSGDLRQVYPILVAAAFPYFATDTGRQIHIKVFESDEAIKLIEGPGSN